MPDILTAITSLAVSIFRERTRTKRELPGWYGGLLNSDPVLQEALRASQLPPASHEALNKVAGLVLAEPEFAAIAPREDQLDPMLLHPGGGSRTPPSALITALFSSAFLQIYCLRLPTEESTFVRTVIEGFEELRRAVRGERVRGYGITGIARLVLPEGTQASTPWGIIRAAPPVNKELGIVGFSRPTMRCLLAQSRLVSVKFDRSPSPEDSFDVADRLPSGSGYLFPLACALASRESSSPAVPLMIWSTLILPFQSGFGYSFPLVVSTIGADADFGDRIEELEEWARVVDRAHVPAIDIAARRLVSAVAHRLDRSDSLIDAVIVWENLFGTSSEVTFRVSGALAKLLERDVTKRHALRKELARIYDIRSRLVHGATVDVAEVDKACSRAIDIAVQALRASYAKGSEWLSLSSNERSDSILLD